MTPKSELPHVRRKCWYRAFLLFFAVTGVCVVLGKAVKPMQMNPLGAILLGSSMFFTDVRSSQDLLTRYVAYFIFNGGCYLLLLREVITWRKPEMRVMCATVFAGIWLMTGFVFMTMLAAAGC